MEPEETARYEMQSDVVEARQQMANINRRKDVQMGGITLRRASPQEPEAVLDSKSVRHRAYEGASRPKNAMHLVDECLRIAHVLEEFAGDDDVEASIFERERLLGVSPDGLDAQIRSLLESVSIDVHPDHVVPDEVSRCESAVPTADVQNTPPGSIHVQKKEISSLLAGEDEFARPRSQVVSPVTLARAVKPAHDGGSGRGPG